MYNGIYPAGISPYTPPIYKKDRRKVESETDESQKASQQDNSNQNTDTSSSQKKAVDFSQNKINISQVLIDFKNTVKAIGASSEVEQEVDGYIQLIEKQASKDNPSKSIIVGNLKSASTILDGYISEALNKDSNVVKEWVDAILLQPIDYKADKTVTAGYIETVHPEISTKKLLKEDPITPETNTKVQEIKETKVETTAVETSTNQNLNPHIQQALAKAQSLTEQDNPSGSLKVLAKALKYAKKTNDKEAESSIYLQAAKTQDAQNKVAQSLKCYNNAAQISSNTGDTLSLAEAHTGMGSIYDDFGYFDNAMDHYFSALAFDGENENLEAQSQVLKKIGDMYVSKYEQKEAIEFYKVGFGLSKEVSDIDGMGEILSSTAGAYDDLGQGQKALKYFGDSIKLNSKANKQLEVAQSYEKAGDIMFENGKSDKAFALYEKSSARFLKIQNKSEDAERLNKKMTNIKVF